VLDSDTIVVGGIHVRLKGVATPEVAHYAGPDYKGYYSGLPLQYYLVM
jgi:endonuclease YncB( thermonuclease family)